jgi:predicted nucleic acid-binding protein
MNRWVIDSNVFIDASRAARSRSDPATRFLARAAREGELWSVTPVRTEVGWMMRDGELPIVQALFDRVFWLDVTTDIADRAAQFGRRYARTHGIGVVDAMIAAAAETLSASVATRNIRHFPMFPDLRPPY